MHNDDQGSLQGRVGPTTPRTSRNSEATVGTESGRHRARSRPEGSRQETSRQEGHRQGRRRQERRPRGRRARSEQGREKEKGSSFFRELPVLVVVALGLALLVKAFAVQAFYIPSASMENTLRIGDRVLVNKLAYDLHRVHRGDIVVFNGAGSFSPAVPESQPDNPFEATIDAVAGVLGVASSGEKDFIKRVIGIPGDHVACCDSRGRVTVNGVPLNAGPFLHPRDVPSKMEFSATVPAGRLWVMGDHRSVSSDSRAHLGDPGGGSIPVDHVVGRAFAVVWPVSHMELLAPPRTFEQPAIDQRAASATGPGARDMGEPVPAVAGMVGVGGITLLRRRKGVRAFRRCGLPVIDMGRREW